MESSMQIKQISSRLREIFNRRKLPLWPGPESISKSAVLTDLHAEWSIHYIATLETINSGALEIANWYNDCTTGSELKDKAIGLPLLYLKQACDFFEQEQLENYIQLLWRIAEAAPRVFGIGAIKDAFEVIEALRTAWETARIRHAEARATDEFLFVVEESMRQMLLAALLVETQAGSLTGRFKNYEPVDLSLMEQWKKPIVDRILSARAELVQRNGGPQYLTLPTAGLWPSGL